MPISGGALRLGVVLLVLGGEASGQSTAAPPYVPGVTFQTTNANYPQPNPFYFEGRIDWNLLNITNPANAWEFAQRGIHKQDDLQDVPDAITDYQTSVSMQNLSNGTCQIVTTPVPASGVLNPPPCMFTVRLRLAGLMRQSAPATAISLYREVTMIDPLRLGVHASIAETFAGMAGAETDPLRITADYNQAISEYQAELALSPVTAFTTALTGDLANNAHVHWGLSQIYNTVGNAGMEANELDLYLKATQWHSDTYPWRITWAKARLAQLGVTPQDATVQPEARPSSQPREAPRSGPVPKR